MNAVPKPNIRAVIAHAQISILHVSKMAAGGASVSTSSRVTHLRDRHPNVYAEVHPNAAKKGAASNVATVASKQPTLQLSVERTPKYPTQCAMIIEIILQ